MDSFFWKTLKANITQTTKLFVQAEMETNKEGVTWTQLSQFGIGTMDAYRNVIAVSVVPFGWPPRITPWIVGEIGSQKSKRDDLIVILVPSGKLKVCYWTLPFYITGHLRNLNLEVPSIYKAYIRPYVREYPSKIWPYMVQYLHFRILKFPLIIVDLPNSLNIVLTAQYYGLRLTLKCRRGLAPAIVTSLGSTEQNASGYPSTGMVHQN